MCRLYGFLATEATKLDCSLVAAQNALVVQSDRDLRGRRNADGWGIAHWTPAGPEVVKSTSPAFADRRFVESAEGIWSDAVIAHVRAATVGRVDEANTHPFRYGPWVFAHNGTVPSFEHVATHLDPGPFGPPAGDTDSELAFLWLLNRMADHGLDPSQPAGGAEPLMNLLTESVLELVRISLRVGVGEVPKLNFLVSDGRHLAATRWGNSLYWTDRTAVRDCAVCGTSHCPSADDSYRAVAIASEPITDEIWQEVPDGSVLGVERGGRPLIRSLVADPVANMPS